MSKTPDGLDVYNPIDHGIGGFELMVSASGHNKCVAKIQEERDFLLSVVALGALS